MKFPRIPVVLLVVASLAWSVVVPSTSAKARASKASKTTSKPKNKPKSVVQDSLRPTGPKLRLDSLKAADSLQRHVADSLRAIDSLAQLQTALRHDSLQRAESLQRTNHTWYLATVRDLSQNPVAAGQLLDKIRLQLLRRGSIFLANPGSLDLGNTFEASWNAGLASKAGKLFYAALDRTPDSGWSLTSWVYELSSGKKLDSASVLTNLRGSKGLDEVARLTARKLHPNVEEAKCNEDSLIQARTAWTLWPVAPSKDSASLSTLLESFTQQMRGSGRASLVPSSVAPNCSSRKCLDSIASALGAHRTLQLDLSRAVDSSWKLGLVVSDATTGTLVDSFLVTSKTLDLLASKAFSLLVPAPVTCRSSCQRPDVERSKLVWSLKPMGSDSARRLAALALGKKITEAFSVGSQNQFLTLQASPAAGQSEATRSKEQGITRMMEGELKGSDSLWTLAVQVKNPQTDSLIQSITLSRGGYQPRVFAWFARKLVESTHPSPLGCGSPCSEDSAQIATSSWAFPSTIDHFGADKTLAKLINDNLVGAMVSKKLGKVVSLPDTLACQTLHCIDSIAASRGARHVVWTVLSKQADSSWELSARVSEAATDLYTDSTSQSDNGNPIEALAHLPQRTLQALIPSAPRCDSCVSLDTLEAGLALMEPTWKDVIDTLQTTFTGMFSEVLSKEGHFQVIPWSATDSNPYWKTKRCDSACRSNLRCRTGATYMATSSVSRDGSGWRVSAQLIDLRTGEQIAQMTTHEPRNDIQRLREIAPWAARKLIGTDSTGAAPSSRRLLDLPWGKLIALSVQFTAGLISIISRW